MDYLGIKRGSIRAEAYKKLASLSLESNVLSGTSGKNDLNQIYNRGKTTSSSSKAMSQNELDALLAICAATSGEVETSGEIEKLVDSFANYLLALPHQQFSSSVHALSDKDMPWLVLGESLTGALINLAFKKDRSYMSKVIASFTRFIEAFFSNSEYGLSNYLALLGVLYGATSHAQLFAASEKGFNLFRLLDTCIDNVKFLKPLHEYSSNLFDSPEIRYCCGKERMSIFSPILFIDALGDLMCQIANSVLGNSSKPLLEFLVSKASEGAQEISETESLATADEVLPKQNGVYDNNLVDRTNALSVSASNISESTSTRSFKESVVQRLAENALKKIEVLDYGEVYIIYSSMSRLKLGYSAKSKFLSVFSCGVFNDIIDEQISKNTFQNSLGIHDALLDHHLGSSIIQLGSLLVFKDQTLGSSLTRAFTSLVADPKLSAVQCQVISKCVGLASRVLSQDTVVTTIYALSNLLFVDDDLHLQSRSRKHSSLRNELSASLNGSRHNDAISHRSSKTNALAKKKSFGNDIATLNEGEYEEVTANAITAITEVVAACGDESVSTLAVTILSQKVIKFNTSLTPLLLKGLISCAPYLPSREFVILVRLLHKLSFDAFQEKNYHSLDVLKSARCDLARKLDQSNPLYTVYLSEMLASIISKGDVQVLDHHRSHNEISAIGDQISIYLKPLAELLPKVYKDEEPFKTTDSALIDLFRNIWFNMVVHGYSINSENSKRYATELKIIAYNTPPLASDLSWDRTETSLELNTVLKRGSSNHNVKDHKHIVGDIFETPRTMSYSKLMFLAAAIFVESLRVKSGDCHTILRYYSDPSMKTSGIDKYLGPIAFKINKDFIALINCGANKQFCAENIANQLTSMLTLCCYGLVDLQDAAIKCCDLLITKVPSSLCHPLSLFALFDLLTLLYDSVMDAEVSQYEPTFMYRAKKTGISLKLPDSYTWRLETFTRFHGKAREWVKLLLLKCSSDTKSLIQSYSSEIDKYPPSSQDIQFGTSFALEMAGSINPTDRHLSHLPKLTKDSPVNLLPTIVSQLAWRSNMVSDVMDRMSFHTKEESRKAFSVLRGQVISLKTTLLDPQKHVMFDQVTDLMSEIAAFTLIQDDNLAELVRYLVEIPFLVFESSRMQAATNLWGAVMKERPDLSIMLLSQITKYWEVSIQLKQGIFSKAHDLKDCEFSKMEYTPSDFKHVSRIADSVSKTFEPHSQIIKLVSSNFEATMNQSDHLLKTFTRFVRVGLKNMINGSLHPFARFIRFELVSFAFDILGYHSKLGSRSCEGLTELIFDSSLSWFQSRSSYPFGNNRLKFKADFVLLKEVAGLISRTNTFKKVTLEQKKELLLYFLDDEISKIGVWLNPIGPEDSRGKLVSGHVGTEHISRAYAINPQLAVNLASRYKLKHLDEVLQKLIVANPTPSIPYSDTVQYFIGINAVGNMPSHELLFWEVVSPIDAISLFLPPFGKNPFILQYTMRSLEHHDVNLTFFYVPQIVQSLRFDVKGYVRRFILETARVSQLFAHQIIWNMLANSYKDEESTEPDSLKPTLDKIQETMLKSLSPGDLTFYEREFGFFNEVTSISGKLKPYIKKSKAEKKMKIDEEMAKIELQPGVYLPSNPDGVLVDINRKSGKPLQSHAKAPFMATFKIRKEVDDFDEYGNIVSVPIEKWQSAIFKVGDDCRQDVLALQLISVFRTIWLNAGLDLYVFPYRVTATAPGCGVIDVLPNSTSRDMLGREAVNGLYEYYTTKFGPESSIEFQQARNNLIRSLAAYSIISFLLQFKDRHNGNIMYDDQGHVLHIDFGFCFDIVPGGVKFEAVPFKLTKEMVMVLGGSNSTQAFKWFEELCIKGYLACRPYMELIVRCVKPMLESGLPCFKDSTIKKLRKRFVPTKSEREAALYFKGLINKSYESFYTTGYDEFQRLTNGIPY
ncbi:Phosphatidylinositol 3- and 4-kinase family protein [Clavispora lusitaniae]|uniref:Phosphatidylinositol 3- and 4-kinase family protein n=1 Tax=Clavispora lusitaniae TaxID=36911 RepID=UPI00202BECBF|nr:Phosphatidylinositol 3- and 4-kinase family protein [Clavispora lusitaniae]